MRHFVSLNDFRSDELHDILDLAVTIKQELRQEVRKPRLSGKMLAMIFEKQSLRTRVSFETGMFQLGGSAMFLSSEVGFGKREATKDFSQVLSSMVDFIMFRAMKHQSVLELARHSTCPVINGLTDQEHPCQAMADYMTMQETFGHLDGLKIAWVGDANNVAASLLHGAAKFGATFAIASPKGYDFDENRIRQLIGDSQAKGFRFETSNDPVKAVKDAHVVTTDVWVSMGQEAEEAERKPIFSPYQVNEALMSHAREDAIFLHCLPARRGLEVTDEVIDSPQSRIVQQAENRLHAQKGILVWLNK